MERAPTSFLLLALVLAAGCNDRSTGPDPAPSPALAPDAACPANPDFVVRNESELLESLDAAGPGDVIAVDGFFAVGEVVIRTDELTLACAVAGSGLDGRDAWVIVALARRVTVQGLILEARGTEGAFLAHHDGVTEFGEDPRFLGNTVTCAATPLCVRVASPAHALAQGGLVAGNRITVTDGGNGLAIRGLLGARAERNTIVATSPSGQGIRASASQRVVIADNLISGPWFAGVRLFEGFVSGEVSGNRIEGPRGRGAILLDVADLRFVRNSVECGLECLFAQGVERVLVGANEFRSAGSSTGVHMQLGVDGSRVEGNTLIATAPSTGPAFGAIRVRDGGGVVIARNVVRGPWANSIALADLDHGLVEQNDLEGAGTYGIWAASGATFRDVSMTDNAFRYNRIRGAGSAGVFLTSACRNEFLGNNLQGNAGDLGAIFDQPTGANGMAGNETVVIDNGDFDCDGDGVADPNAINGPGSVKRGVAFERPAADAGTATALR